VKLVTFRLGDSGRPHPGALVDDEILDLGAPGLAPLLGERQEWGYTSVLDVLRAGDLALTSVRGAVARVAQDDAGLRGQLRNLGHLCPLATTTLLAPIPNPQLVVCAASNYGSHSREMSGKPPSEPPFFIKASGCVVGPGHAIVLPPEAPDMVDYEGELCVVIGRPAYRVAEAEALDYVAGYCCGNDVSARDWVRPLHAWRQDPTAQQYESFLEPSTLNIRYKSFPTFMPAGPVLVTADEIPDPQDLRIRTIVNDQVLQDTSTEDMTYGVARLIAHYSRYLALAPGDIIATGSPPGVGVARTPPIFLRAGDTVTVEIERIGALTNPVVASE
jgi:2-keto-4-pentenoate hydratase/2-oxohepta-3-ene-1,7-dioic acid hydratase in catechol pathway